ncbi:MAG: SIMPL domain-containing protein [Crocinitomicaceae bacterium]|nr:SIMPL domain-containing protein [Crocinitomicaceae bacterium]
MNNLKLLFTGTILSITILTFGQTTTTTTNEEPYIEVTGTAEKEVIPDEIYIGITIREKYLNKVKVTIGEQEEKLKNTIQLLGIDMANLTLTDANADYVKIHWKNKDVLTKKDYTLKVSNATTVGQVFQELDKLEITDAFISSVNHSKMDSLRKEIKIAAIKAAKNKADYLLTAIGEQTGKPLIIKETVENNSSSNVNFRGSRSNETYYFIDGIKVKDSDENEIQFQKIKIQSSIYVKFSIK